MAQFKDKVDRAIELVKDRKMVLLDALAYELGVSFDYARKVALVATAACTDPPLALESLFNRRTVTHERPALWVKSYLEEEKRKQNADDELNREEMPQVSYSGLEDQES